MTVIRFPVLVILTVAVLGAYSAFAQSVSSDTAASTDCDTRLVAAPPGVDPCAALKDAQGKHKVADGDAPKLVQDETTTRQETVRYVPDLMNGGEPIPVPQYYRLRYLYGGSASVGYDSAVAGPFRNLPSSLYVAEGFVGASRQFTKTQVLIQHASTTTRYSTSAIQGQTFHRTSLLLAGDLNRFWSWDIAARNTFGDDSLRLIAPMRSQNLDEFATADPGAAVYGVHSGNVWGTDAVSSLNWHATATRTVKMYLKDAYHHLSADNSHTNIATLRFEYEKAVSPRTSYGLYGQRIHETGQILCNSNGAGAYLALRPAESTLLEFAAGPEFGAKSCGRQQAVSLHFAAASAMNSVTRLYLAANREFSSGYISRGTWEDNIVVGASRTLSRFTTLGVDAGYVKGTVLGRLTSYHGYFASTELRRRLSNNFSISATYRLYNHSVSQEAVRRNAVLLTLIWNPSRHEVQRNDAKHTGTLERSEQ